MLWLLPVPYSPLLAIYSIETFQFIVHQSLLSYLQYQYRWTSGTLLLKPVVETIVFFLQTFYDVAMFILDAHIAFCIHFILVN